MSAQIIKWIENERWIKAAQKANNYALSIKNSLSKNKNIIIEYTVDINMVFARIPIAIQDKLKINNVSFNPWYGSDNLTRFVTSWDTTSTEIKNFDNIIINLEN